MDFYGMTRAVWPGRDAGLALVACVTHRHEGIVLKRKGSRYAGGRCGCWRKIKTAAWRAANAERWKVFP